MTVFEYKALNAKGKNISGIVDADNQAAAQGKLKQQNLFPVSLRSVESKTDGNGSESQSLKINLFSRIKSSEIAMITQLISTLLSAGFPLVKAVSTVVGQTRSKSFQKILSSVKDAIEKGSTFADALAQYPKVFSPVYINMVAAGESSGTLEIVLERLADFSEKKEENKKKIQAALAYPIIMCVIGFLVLIILLTYIVPGIIDIFSDLNQALPLPTLVLINVSNFFKSFWWAIMLLPFLIMAIIYFVRKTEKGELFLDKLIICLPVAGNLIQKLIAARFSRTLGSLLENGVPLLTALKITKSIAGNKVVCNLIGTATESVQQGGELGETLSKSRYFPNLASQMIKVGEKSGEMEKMLEKSADLYEKDVQTAMTAATSLLEPIIILIMGVVVGMIIMAIYLPMVEINQMVR
ncbi:MAG: type II secretion system inner membrane protein GspF [Desulfobacteraceae bacterium]|nr:type II secretion system inner membrane protein GspF [Desulfobacteraceae bacterium]